MKPCGPRSGWTVLVTGASSGLGKALALELARRKCGLVLTARHAGRLQVAAQEALQTGARSVETVQADLAVEGGLEALVSSIQKRGLTIDALVNNAGAGRAGPWANSTIEDDRSLVRLMVDSPLALTKALLPGWRHQGRGALLNIASTGAFQPGPQTATYYAAKAFLASWSLALAREERQWLAVTTLCPGAMKTRFSESAGKRDVPGAWAPERVARIAIRSWERGRGLVIPGFFNRGLVLFSRLLPPTWMAAAVEGLQLAVRKR